jgi:hypothetical protein
MAASSAFLINKREQTIPVPHRKLENVRLTASENIHYKKKYM